MSTESTRQSGDNYRLPKNLIMVIAIIALGVAAGFTIASTKNTNKMPAESMSGSQQSQTIHPEPEPFRDEKLEEDDETDNEAEEDIEKSEEKHPDAIGMIDRQLPYAPGQAPSTGSNDQTTQIILFSVEAIAASLLVIYLIMSGFNKKSFKETLSNSDKALVYILGSIVLAATFVGTDILIANAINSQQGPNQPQMQNPGMSQPSRPGDFGKPKLQQRKQRPSRPDKN